MQSKTLRQKYIQGTQLNLHQKAKNAMQCPWARHIVHTKHTAPTTKRRMHSKAQQSKGKDTQSTYLHQQSTDYIKQSTKIKANIYIYKALRQEDHPGAHLHAPLRCLPVVILPPLIRIYIQYV